MTQLRFDINKLWATEIEGIPHDDVYAVITETCFLLPVRLIVNNEDIFCIPNKEQDWIELPALDIVLHWNGIIENLRASKTGRILLAGAGQMVMRMEDENVHIGTNFNTVSASTSYAEFQSSIDRDAQQLLSFLTSRFPDILNKEQLQKWKSSK